MIFICFSGKAFTQLVHTLDTSRLTWVKTGIWSALYCFLQNSSRNPAVKLPPITPIQPITSSDWKHKCTACSDWVFPRAPSLPWHWTQCLREWQARLVRCDIRPKTIVKIIPACQLWSKGHLAWQMWIYLLLIFYFQIWSADWSSVPSQAQPVPCEGRWGLWWSEALYSTFCYGLFPVWDKNFPDKKNKSIN